MATNNSINLSGAGIAAYDGAGTFAARTITGTADFIDLANGTGVAGNPTISIASEFEQTGMHGWNGGLLETDAVTVTSDGATVTCSVEQSGGGDLTAVFSDGYYDWDTTPADTVTLTAGSDTSPTLNYVYLLQSDKTLTASTVGWPAAEHAPMCTALCQSAASLQTDGPYKVHVWTDHVNATDQQGHISDLNFWIRQQPATWSSGVAQTYSIAGGPPNNVLLTTGAGVVLQLHDHTFPAFAGTPDVYVVNDSVTPYTVVTDLNAIAADATGATLVGRYYSLVIWGCVSEDTGDCKLFCNLPNGSYNNQTGVEDDADNFAVYTIPPDFTGTGFLISEWKLRQQAAGGGTFTSIAEIDLRGLLPSLTAGGGGSANTEFVDNVFRILNVTNPSKEIAFDAANITTATTRTITMADADLDLATVSNSFPTDGGTAAPTANALTIAGGTGITTAGAATTVTINLDSPVTVANGGTGLTTITDHGVMVGSGIGAVTPLAVGTNGQALIGSTGADPVFATIASSDSLLTLTGGAGTLDIVANQAVSAAAVLTDNLVIRGDGGTRGVQTSTMSITDNGEMTNASQPAFLSHLAGGDDELNVTGDGTNFYLGDTDVGNSLTEIYDQNGDFTPGASGGAYFTAPVTGIYLLGTSYKIEGILSGHTNGFVGMETSNRNAFVWQESPAAVQDSSATLSLNCTFQFDMDAADIYQSKIQVANSTKVIDLDGNQAMRNTMWGKLVC